MEKECLRSTKGHHVVRTSLSTQPIAVHQWFHAQCRPSLLMIDRPKKGISRHPRVQLLQLVVTCARAEGVALCLALTTALLGGDSVHRLRTSIYSFTREALFSSLHGAKVDPVSIELHRPPDLSMNPVHTSHNLLSNKVLDIGCYRSWSLLCYCQLQNDSDTLTALRFDCYGLWPILPA